MGAPTPGSPVLLPDEKHGFTIIPNGEADAAMKLLGKCKGGRHLAVSFMIRRAMGRSNQGNYRKGIVGGLTTSAIENLLGCDSGTASRIRGQAVSRLGLHMIADGTFQLGPAGADAGAGAGPNAETNMLEYMELTSTGAEAGAAASAGASPDGDGLKPASPAGFEVPQELQALQDLQESKENAKHGLALPTQPGQPGLPACAGTASVPGYHFVAPVTAPTSSDWDPGCVQGVVLADLLNSDLDVEGYRALLRDAQALPEEESGLLAEAAPGLLAVAVCLSGTDQDPDQGASCGPSGPFTPSITMFEGFCGCENILAIDSLPYGVTRFAITAVGRFPADTRTEVPAVPGATEAPGSASAPDDEAPASPAASTQGVVPAAGAPEADPSPAPPSPAEQWALACVDRYNAQIEDLPEGFDLIDVDSLDGSYTLGRLVGLYGQGAADHLDVLVEALWLDDFLQGNNERRRVWTLERLAKQKPERLQTFAGCARRKLKARHEPAPDDRPAVRGRRRGGQRDPQEEVLPWQDELCPDEQTPTVESYFLDPPPCPGEEPAPAVQEVERPKPPKQPEEAPLPLTYHEGRMAMDFAWCKLLDDILAAAPRRSGEALGEAAQLQILIALERVRRTNPGAAYVRRSFESLMAETKPDTQEVFCERVVGWLGAGQFHRPDWDS